MFILFFFMWKMLKFSLCRAFSFEKVFDHNFKNISLIFSINFFILAILKNQDIILIDCQEFTTCQTAMTNCLEEK